MPTDQKAEKGDEASVNYWEVLQLQMQLCFWTQF